MSKRIVYLSFLITSLVANSAFAEDATSRETDHANLLSRFETLEQRVSDLENDRQKQTDEIAPKQAEADTESDPASAEDSPLVDVYLIRKEYYYEGRSERHPGIVFDLRFVGTQAIGDRTLKDIKGTVWFRDAFGDKIAGATTTERLSIGAGETAVIKGLVVDWLMVGTDKDWNRVLTTDIEELQVSFEVDQAIYDNSVKLSEAQKKSIQRLLNDKGYNLGTPDGAWGPASRSAMQSFQLEQGLSPSGEPDRAGLEALGFEL